MLGFFLPKFQLGDDGMYLLYVDESGSPTDPDQNFFVLSGVSIFERKTHWVEEELNAIVARFNPQDPYALELHGSPMRSGKSEWKTFQKEDRIQAIKDCLSIIARSQGNIRLFASVIERGANGGDDPIESSFEQVASRFDMFLNRLHKQGNSQRGIAIFDKSTTEKSIQNLARTFKHNGHSYGKLKNFSEVPLFLDSKASRLIQLADLVAFAIYRNFQASDSQYFDIIKNCFDSYAGTVHGLNVRRKLKPFRPSEQIATATVVRTEVVEAIQVDLRLTE